MKLLSKVWDLMMLCIAPMFFEPDHTAEDIHLDVTEEFWHQ